MHGMYVKKKPSLKLKLHSGPGRVQTQTLFYSILFYSILFYSILFYSILFYSILTLKFVQFSNRIYSWILYASQNKNQSHCMKQDHWYFKEFQCYKSIKTLYAFLWVTRWRLNFICQRFGTLCLFHLRRPVGTSIGG
jgi:hypothetical protein